VQIWGILNVTPDSFSDGGAWLDPGDAAAHGRRLAAEGADVVDVGGESTRPGAEPVAEARERERVVPVLRALRAACPGLRLSVDTRHAAVAAAALDAGAEIVNDVSAGADPDMFPVVARRGAELVLMHMRGKPRTMQEAPVYADVLAEVSATLRERVARAVEAGMEARKLWIDPGLGFGKTLEHNLTLLRGLASLVRLGPPVLLGASRKSFLGTLTAEPEPRRRLAGSLACVVRAAEVGVAAVRVHDVRASRQILDVLDRIR
jgi:dihydropteroate synthase